MHPQKLLFSNILKQNKKHTHSLYFGLNLHGGNVAELQIENGEKPEDYHVTLLWGKFTPRSDIDDTVCRIQSVMEEIKNDIPKRLVFYHERRFEASESSDNKDVIVAAVTGGILEPLHKKLLSVLKDEKIEVEKTFPVYVPHLTLAYIEPDAEHELRVLDHSAMVKDITVCIKNIATGEKEYERVFGMVAKSFSEVLKFNPYHDSLGRFASAGGATSFTYKPGASTAHTKAIEREKEKNSSEKGFKGTLYHGSPNTDIEEFDMSRAGQNTSSGEKLLFFTDSKQMADDFSYERLEGSSKFFQKRGKKGRVYEVDVEMKNPLDFRKLSDTDIENIIKLDEDGILTKDMVKQMAGNHQLLKTSLDLRAERLKELGYDGFIANTGKAGHNSLEYAVVDSKQARIKKSISSKSFSELIEKFNPYHDARGRFTTSGTAASFTYRPGASVAHDRAIERERERVRQADKVVTETDKMASYVIENQFISSEKKQCIKDVQNCYQSIALKNGVRWDDEKNKVIAKRSAIFEMKDTARKIMEKQEYEDTTTSQEYYELHRTIKRTPIKISDYDKQNIPDWNDYRRRAFGNLTISNNGLSIDSFYQELSSQFPHLFDSHRETSPSDQLEKLNEVLTSLKPRTYTLKGRELEEAADDLALQMLNGYVAVIKP